MIEYRKISGSRNNHKCMLHVECSHNADGIMGVRGTVPEIAAMLHLLIAELVSRGMPEHLIMHAVADALAGEEDDD